MNRIMLMAAFLGMTYGFFMLLKIEPGVILETIISKIQKKPDSVRSITQEAKGKNRKSYIRRALSDTEELLNMTGRSEKFSQVLTLSLMCFCAGVLIAGVMGNVFLIPVLAFGMMFIPYWYLKLTASHYTKDVSAELETALSIITTAYLRHEDFLTAVEENLPYLNPPVLAAFKDFANRVRFVNSDITAGLYELQGKIRNDVFVEWCDAVIACQNDRQLKSTLSPIVSKLSDMRIVNGELENLIFEPRKEYITMQILCVSNIPLMYFLNKDWFHTLMYTVVGQVVLAVCALAIFISTAFVVKLSQPIEYRR